MNNRIDKAAAEKAVGQKKRMLVFGLCSLVSLVVCTSVVLLVAFSMITEGVYEFEAEHTTSKTPLPQSDADKLAFLSRLVNDASDNTLVRVDSSTDVKAENLICDGTQSEQGALAYMQSTLVSSADELYPADYTGSFGSGFTDFPTMALVPDDCSSAVCAEGFTADDGTVTDDGCYFFTLTVPGMADDKANIGVYDTFRLGADDDAIKKITKKTSSILIIKSSQVMPGDFTVEAKSDRLTDRLLSLTMTRRYTVTLSVSFTGSLTSLGEKTVSFDWIITERFNYEWAGITFSEDSVTVPGGKNVKLSANAVMNNDAKYTIRFESADKSVAAVDELGYITGVKNSKEPVTVTVHLSYLDHNYSDTCKVYVMIPVEKIKVSDDEAALTVGETKRLSATLKPVDATNTDVLWISDDEKVAEVSDDGTLTAVGTGTTSIIAVSADGHFRDSCTVTVTNKGGMN